MHKAGRMALFIFFVTELASAQLPTSGNVFAGYSYLRTDNNIAPSTVSSSGLNFNGWEGSVEGKFLPWIGVVGDFGGNYGSVQPECSLLAPSCNPLNESIHTALFGPRASLPIGRFTLFLQGMVGFAHASASNSGVSTSDTSFAKGIGGGLDYKLIKGLAWRVQGDGLYTHVFGASQNNIRFSTGIVVRF